MIMLGDNEWEASGSSNDYVPAIKGIQQGISVIWSQLPFESCFFSLLMSGNTSQENNRNQESETGFTPFLQADCWLYRFVTST